MKEQNATMYCEAGVSYCFERYPITYPAPNGMVPVKYYRRDNKTNKISEDTVHVNTKFDAFTLVNHWNRTTRWTFWI